MRQAPDDNGRTCRVAGEDISLRRADYPRRYSGSLPARQPSRASAGSGRRRSWATAHRSEEHTSELQSLMRISYAVFCLKKNNEYTYNIQKCSNHKKPLGITAKKKYKTKPNN